MIMTFPQRSMNANNGAKAITDTEFHILEFLTSKRHWS